jgi:DNA polymerase III subunit delta'
MTLQRQDDDAPPSALPWMPLLPWQTRVATDFLARRASFPHALLIHGPRGIGKHALALGLAQGLLCETPRANGEACGTCPGCHYAIAGQHPDLMRLELLRIDEDTGDLVAVEQIAIDRVRTLIEFAALTSHRQRAKVAIIAPAERMNPSASNALLKTLEEPQPGTYLILVSSEPARLAPTIVSRCRKLPAPRPTVDEARTWLAAQGVAQPDIALAQAGGAPLAALAYADPLVEAERLVWVASLSEPDELSVTGLAARIDALGRDQRRARLAWVIDWLIGWTADLARAAAGAGVRANPDASRALASLAARVAPTPLFRYHRSLLRQRALVAHPLVPRLVAESLLIEYRGLFG